MSLNPEVGTIVSRASNDRLDWPTNRECYVFGPYDKDDIKWRIHPAAAFRSVRPAASRRPGTGDDSMG